MVKNTFISPMLLLLYSDEEGKDNWSQSTGTQYDDRTDEGVSQIKDER